MRLIISIWLTLLIIGCLYSGESNVIHPTQDNLPSGENVNVINAEEIRLKDNDSENKKLLSILEGMLEISSVGVLYGAQEEMFGRIEDIVFDSFDRIYVLDYNKQIIRVFSYEGDYMTTLGGKGEGPGQFERARSMTIYNDELLLVSNGYRIEVFDIKDEEEVKFLETLQFEKSIRSICISGDKLFAHYNQITDQYDKTEEGNYLNMIQAYFMPTFEPLFSFGQSYKSNEPQVVERMSTGDLSCNESSSTVVFAFERMQVLHGYSAEDGQLKWESRIDGLHFSTVTEINEGGRKGLSYRIPESNIMDRILSTVSFQDEYEILQVERRMLPEEGSFETNNIVLTFLLNSSNGEGSLASYEKPRILHISNHLMASVMQDFMVCRIYKFNFQRS